MLNNFHSVHTCYLKAIRSAVQGYFFLFWKNAQKSDKLENTTLLIQSDKFRVSLAWQPTPQATDITKSALFIIYLKKLY